MHSKACILISLFVSCFVLGVQGLSGFEKDNMYPGLLTFPKDWSGEIQMYCDFPELSRAQQHFFVRQRLFSIVGASSSQNGALYFRPTDLTFPDKCPGSPSNNNFISFSETVSSFSVSPLEDLSVLVTYDASTPQLKLALIDPRDLFVSYKLFALDPKSFGNTTNPLVKLSTVFLSNRFLLIELPVAQFLYDRTTEELTTVSLPFSILRNERFALHFEGFLRVFFLKPIAGKPGVTTMQLNAFRYDNENFHNFTLEWTYNFNQTIYNSPVMYHAILRQVIVTTSSSLLCLNAATGQKIYEGPASDVYKLAGNVRPSFFVAFSNRTEEWTFNSTTSNYTTKVVVNYLSLNTLAVGQSGDLFLQYWDSDYNTIVSVYRQNRSLTVISRHATDLSLFAPTNHFLLVVTDEGRMVLYKPIVSPPTPAPTPYNYPTPDYYPTPYNYPTPDYYPTPYYYPTPDPYYYYSFWDSNLWFRITIFIVSGVVGLGVIGSIVFLIIIKRRQQSRYSLLQNEPAFVIHPQTPPDYMLMINQHPPSNSPGGPVSPVTGAPVVHYPSQPMYQPPN
eukprot:TRINITY_DN301_c0_g1_i1.p1 TRINITY_DN301_c0_g1~~TRINITY_DN301_c0_g1_i1.p1  ORF type:complete len:561 (-),score=113.52 TRINITY_DN301_c0_g1_i1:111-1793(-)